MQGLFAGTRSRAALRLRSLIVLLDFRCFLKEIGRWKWVLMMNRMLVQDGDTDEREEEGFSASGCLSASREDRKARCFRRVVPCVASSAAEHAGRHSLGHRFLTRIELQEHCRSSFMINHEPLFNGHVLFSCSPTNNSHENVRVQCILYAATRLLDIWLIAISG